MAKEFLQYVNKSATNSLRAFSFKASFGHNKKSHVSTIILKKKMQLDIEVSPRANFKGCVNGGKQEVDLYSIGLWMPYHYNPRCNGGRGLRKNFVSWTGVSEIF